MHQRGVSLIELIIFIVIIGIALIGLLNVMNIVSRNSADPMIHKQAIAVAESLLEEIQLQDFISASGVHSCTNGVGATCVASATRATGYFIIQDYDGFYMNGIAALNGNGVVLPNYQASVVVAAEALGGIGAASAVKISVIVTPPSGDAITSVGYRTAY